MPTLLIESGDFLFSRKPRAAAETAAGSVKANLILRAYRRMGYDAVLPGETDFSAGRSLLRRYGNDGVPFTCLNLVSARSGKPIFPPLRTLSRGGMRILVTGLIGEDVLSKGAQSGYGWKVLPPHAALDELLARREAAGADLVVVLTHVGGSGVLALARGIKRPLLIFQGHPDAPPRSPAFESGIAVFQGREKGTHLLEVSVGPVPGSGKNDRTGFADATRIERYKLKKQQLLADMGRMETKRRKMYERTVESLDNAIRIGEERRLVYPRTIPLDSRIPDDPKVTAMISNYKKALARIPKESNPADTLPGAYLGHAACSGCHQKNSAAWRTEAHARAFETLKKQGDGENPDCLGCHVTGYGRRGFVPSSPERAKELGGVGCEACHGPGKGHPGRRMSIPGEKTCAGCHAGLGPFPFSEKRRLLGCVKASRGGQELAPGSRSRGTLRFDAPNEYIAKDPGARAGKECRWETAIAD